MFGYVMANMSELDKQQKKRYSSVYCGICRSIRDCCGQFARLGLSYDMAFLALLLMSLYEPEEESGKPACVLHPMRSFVDNEFVRYSAQMNVALMYYKCLDDVSDEGNTSARIMARRLEKALPEIERAWPRQCRAIRESIAQLTWQEKENCPNPDEPAASFGQLMAELLVYKEDMWAATLREMGTALGRYIYLADAAVDYKKDKKKNAYNPYLAMGMEADWQQWEQYLVLSMGRCTKSYERLPLVQDKKLLDNILYSGIWLEYRRRQGGNASSREVLYDK